MSEHYWLTEAQSIGVESPPDTTAAPTPSSRQSASLLSSVAGCNQSRPWVSRRNAFLNCQAKARFSLLLHSLNLSFLIHSLHFLFKGGRII